ncbi:MAG: hypothetical protein GEU81_08855 [Nitriliruptorales bacterium]|nr:hypothetical protein [Nitriliruptorales bacterium]
MPVDAHASPRHRISQALHSIVPAQAETEVVVVDKDLLIFRASVVTASVHHEFDVTWVGEGWPAEIRRALAAVGSVTAMAAKRFSPGALELLREANVGWLDETGQANVSVPSGLVLFREPHPDTSRPTQIPTRWTRSVITVAEALLAGSAPTVADVEAHTGLSRGSVTNALRFLEGQALLKRPGPERGPNSGRHIESLEQLLDAYTTAAGQAWRTADILLFHRVWRDSLQGLVSDLAPALNSAPVTWAAGGTTAAQLVAPYLTSLTVLQLYVPAELLKAPQQLAHLLEARAVKRGHRIEVRAFPTPTSLPDRSVHGVPVVPWFRTYADLMARGGREAEAAQHLKETISVGATTQSQRP